MFWVGTTSPWLFFIYPTRFAISAHSGADLSNNAITLIMVGLDVVAFLIGLIFGKMMQSFRHGMKYLPPTGFICGFLLLSMGSSLPLLLAGSAFIGIANGIGVQHRTTRHDHHIVGKEEFVEEFEGVSLVPAGIIVVLQVARRNKIMFYARELLRRRCRSTDRYAPENLTTVTIEDRAAVMLRYPQ